MAFTVYSMQNNCTSIFRVSLLFMYCVQPMCLLLQDTNKQTKLSKILPDFLKLMTKIINVIAFWDPNLENYTLAYNTTLFILH